MTNFNAFARFYDADYGSFVEDVPFYRELARRAGGSVVELMCGSGRLLVPLAQAGLRITGVDIAPELLQIARARVADEGLGRRVRLHEADICEQLPGAGFALAIVALNSFMHLASAEKQIAALRNIHAILEPGGLLALDLFNPDPVDLARHNGDVVLDKIFQMPDGTTVQKYVAQSVDFAAQLNHVTFIYDEISAEGYVRRTSLPFPMRWLYRYELEHLLARSGFELEAVYGSYELDEYATGTELMLAVARKISL